MNDKFDIIVIPFGIDQGKYEIVFEAGATIKSEVVSGYLGEWLQKNFGDKTHFVKVEVREV
jgi:hypothetical protein